MPTREGLWTEEELVNCAAGKKRDSTWMDHQEREYKFPEIFGFFDPDMLAPSEKPPTHVQVALEETFGDRAKTKRVDGRPDLILRMHPWFRRWTLFERAHITERAIANGAPHTAFKPVMVCCEWATKEAKWREELRPQDLRDRRYSELWGAVGDYKLPDRRDFEDFKEKADRYSYTHAERAARLRKAQYSKDRDYETTTQAMERDLCDYGFAAYYRDLVRTIGGGQGLPFVPQTSLEAFDAERFLMEPIYNDAGEVLYYKRHSKERLRRALEDAQTARAKFEGALDEAGLDKAALVAVYLHFDRKVPRELEAYLPEAIAARLPSREEIDVNATTDTPIIPTGKTEDVADLARRARAVQKAAV